MSQSTVDDIAIANATLIVDDLWSQNSKYRRDRNLKILTKIYKNITTKPNEAKYRRINIVKINSKPDIAPQLQQLLLSSGFKKDINNIYMNLDVNNIQLCIKVGKILQDRIDEEQRELDAERERIRLASKKKQDKYKDAQNKKRAAVNAKINLDKKDLAQEFKPSGASKACNLKFGAKNVKVEFKTSGGGGG